MLSYEFYHETHTISFLITVPWKTDLVNLMCPKEEKEKGGRKKSSYEFIS